MVYIEPGEEHWHGATADRFKAHVAIQEAEANGQVVTWLEHVSDDEYTARYGQAALPPRSEPATPAGSACFSPAAPARHFARSTMHHATWASPA